MQDRGIVTTEHCTRSIAPGVHRLLSLTFKLKLKGHFLKNRDSSPANVAAGLTLISSSKETISFAMTCFLKKKGGRLRVLQTYPHAHVIQWQIMTAMGLAMQLKSDVHTESVFCLPTDKT